MEPGRVFTAHVDAWQAHGRLFAPFGGATAEFPGWRLMASGLPYSYLNSACVTDADIADPDLARAWYKGRGLGWGAVVSSGSPWPHGRRLVTQGLMALDLENFDKAPRTPGLVVRRAKLEDLGDVVAVDTGAFGSSPAAVRAWLGPLCGSAMSWGALGRLDGGPVATGYCTTTTGSAGTTLYVGGIGVIPTARRQGIAAGLVTYLLTRGFAAGATFAHLQTNSDNAARVYTRLGFAHFGAIDIYAVD